MAAPARKVACVALSSGARRCGTGVAPEDEESSATPSLKGVLGFCGGGLFPERTIVEAAGTRALLSASNSGSLKESGEDLERPSDGGEMPDDLAMASPGVLRGLEVNPNPALDKDHFLLLRASFGVLTQHPVQTKPLCRIGPGLRTGKVVKPKADT